LGYSVSTVVGSRKVNRCRARGGTFIAYIYEIMGPSHVTTTNVRRGGATILPQPIGNFALVSGSVTLDGKGAGSDGDHRGLVIHNRKCGIHVGGEATYIGRRKRDSHGTSVSAACSPFSRKTHFRFAVARVRTLRAGKAIKPISNKRRLTAVTLNVTNVFWAFSKCWGRGILNRKRGRGGSRVSTVVGSGKQNNVKEGRATDFISIF
jgi:hypothetical protein